MKTLFRGTGRAIMIMILAAAAAACTVKEDRDVCPCWLEVGFLDREDIKDPVVLTGWGDAEVFDDNVTTADYPDTYACQVPRAMLYFGALEGLKTNRHEGHTVTIPSGAQCDSLYGYHDIVDCRGESARTDVDFHKQFATVTMFVIGGQEVAEKYRYTVKSGTCGIDILTCEAVEGGYWYRPQPVNGSLRYRLPRQADDTMTMTVDDADGETFVFPFGQYIKSVGYDWHAIDLKDIHITLDIVHGKVSVGIADWEDADDFQLKSVEN